MRGFFYRLNNTIERFMQGRYGIDKLCTFLLITGFALWFLAMIRPLSFLIIPALAIIIFAYMRVFSKNYVKRTRELNKYLTIKNKLQERWHLLKRIRRERKTHRYFKCKACKTRLRVPRGKGKIEITCPKCRTKVIKKT